MVGQECGTGCEWQSLRRRKTWRDGTAHKLDKDYVVSETQVYSDSKNPFHTNLNGGAHSAPPNTVGIALSFGGVINSTYPWLQNRPLGHVIWFTGCRDMAKSKQ